MGRQENLCEDLIRILKYFNEPSKEGWHKKEFAQTRRNKSKPKFGFRYELTEEQKNKVYFSEKSFYNKYYE